MDCTSLFPHPIMEFLRCKGLGAVSSDVLYQKQSTYMVITFLLNEVTYRTAPLVQYLVTTRRGMYTATYVLHFSLGIQRI